MWIAVCLFGWLSLYILGFFMDPISRRNYIAFLEKKLLKASKFLPFGKYSLRKFMKRVLNSTLKKVIKILKKDEEKMSEWQRGIRILYKDLQASNGWSDDEIWAKVKTELLRNSKGKVGCDDLDWIKPILRAEKDITIFEAQRMFQRFKYSTPLLDALENLKIN